jgi:hypothetical protein
MLLGGTRLGSQATALSSSRRARTCLTGLRCCAQLDDREDDPGRRIPARRDREGMAVLAYDRHVGLAVAADRLAAECFDEEPPLAEVHDARALDVSRVVVHGYSLAAASDRT